ncbi:MAG TPA: polysaccharide pyruvyl transferase CsaB [Drouetiella sp.]
MTRNLVLVSGYYGFANLGDEAILEEITNELKKLVEPEQIVILSNNPEQTSKVFGVQAINRWKLSEFIQLLPRTKLFISGGGGLFQDATGFKSAIFYGTQMIVAKKHGCKVAVYAQGVGPLRGMIATKMAKTAFARADEILVRDKDSKDLLSIWKVQSKLTADPVWCLEQTSIPLEADKQIQALRERPGLTVGLSLRTSHNFGDTHRERLLDVLEQSLPTDAKLLLLPLQSDQDMEPLSKFAEAWKAKNRTAEFLKTDEMQRPSQWIAVLAQLDMLVAMRLHALIMSLKSGVPSIGIAYDPKVKHVLNQFQQPILILSQNSEDTEKWLPTVQNAVATRTELADKARQEAERAKTMACQNFETLARILEHAK